MNSPPASNWAIEAEGLCKRYPINTGWRDILRRRRYRTALQGVGFRLERGRVLGLLGANGAGKTTLLKILCTALIPDGGSARILGHDLETEAAGAKRRIGMVVNEERSFYFRLSCRRNLEFFAALWDLHGPAARERIDELLELVGLSERAEDRFDRLSTGMRQRMAIARGLLMDPELLFLDEPTRSLDPVTTDQMHRFIREELVEIKGKTVVVATNDLGEAEALAQELLVLREGEVAASGSMEEFAKHGREGMLELLRAQGNERDAGTTGDAGDRS